MSETERSSVPAPDPTNRVALCHEWLTTYGGSEQVAAAIARALNVRDVFTFTGESALAAKLFPDSRMWLHRLGKSQLARDHWQWFLPILPLVWGRLDLREYAVVITSSHSVTNALRPRDGVIRISYCHTPMRYAWQWRSELKRIPVPVRPLWPLVAAAFRQADRSWARSVDVFVANSRHVAGRIRSAYHRDAEVLYPPIDTAFWSPGSDQVSGDYFLALGRLVAYKRLDLAIRAATLSRQRLVIAGDGPLYVALKAVASPYVEFVRRPTNGEVRELYRNAKALVVPGVEDFGMTMVESQACGTPVIAYDAGGAQEAVVRNVSGVLFADRSLAGMAAVLGAFRRSDFATSDLRESALRFDKAVFDSGIRAIVAKACTDFGDQSMSKGQHDPPRRRSWARLA